MTESFFMVSLAVWGNTMRTQRIQFVVILLQAMLVVVLVIMLLVSNSRVQLLEENREWCLKYEASLQKYCGLSMKLNYAYQDTLNNLLKRVGVGDSPVMSFVNLPIGGIDDGDTE